MKKTLFVGCGGSGITTLLRVNELLASNPVTRDRLREDVSYMVVDTETKKVSEFINGITAQMDGRGLPTILPVQVTKGYHKLHEIVNPNFIGKDAKSLELLKPHWWFTPDEGERSGSPFRGVNLTQSLQEGASQCPAVSYLATWNYLSGLKSDISRLLETIGRINSDEESPLSNLNVILVSSLAGGTGRGCWNLLAFKIQQCLKEMGAWSGSMTGVFFDASCFPDVKKPGNVRKLRMNSLTGVSELSAWLQLPNGPDYSYSLPVLSAPNPDHVNDVIKGSDEPTDRTPVTTAIMVFGDNGKVSLKESRQYYEMAATALYSLVATGNSISATGNNQLERVRSFGAATFEVETVKLRRYLRTRVQLNYSHRLICGDQQTPQEAKECIGDPKGKMEQGSFFGRTGFFVKESAKDFVLGGGGGASQPLLARLMARADEQIAADVEVGKGQGKKKRYSSWNDIEAALDDSDQNDATEKAEKTLTELDPDVVRGWELALGVVGLDEEHLLQTLRNEIRSAFYRQGQQNTDTGEFIEELPPSVARAKQAIAILVQAFNESILNMEGTPDSPVTRLIAETGETLSNPPDCASKFSQKIDEKSDHRIYDGFKMFGKGEIATLERLFNTYKQESVFFFLLGYLTAKFKRAKRILEHLGKSLETLEQGLSDVEDIFKEDLCRSFERATESEVFNELFINDDDDSIFNALPKPTMSEKAYHRNLKPIMRKEDVEALLAKPSLTAQPLAEQLKQDFDKLIKGGTYAAEDARSSIRDVFVKLVRGNVGLPKVAGGDFMRTHFSFEKVLENNREKWNCLLKHKTDTDDEDELLDRIRIFLGVAKEDMEKVTDGDRKVLFIPAKILLPSLVGSLVSVCRPWMTLKKGSGLGFKDNNTFALVPVDLDKAHDGNEKHEFDNQVKRVYTREGENSAKVIKSDAVVDSGLKERDVSTFHLGDDCGPQLPEDRVLIFSEIGIGLQNATATTGAAEDINPFNIISSLDYWSDPEWMPWLTQSEVLLAKADMESVNGDAYFVRSQSKYSNGWKETEGVGGHVSPIFLANEILNELRWKPWMLTEVRKNDADQRKREVMSALLFGLLGSGVGSDLLAAVEKKGWTGFPLLKMSGKGKGAESLVFQRTSKVDELAWNEKDVLGTTLEKARGVLLGSVLPNEMRTSEVEERVKRGVRIRQALLNEKKEFEKVLLALAEEDRTAIRDALGKYLAAQARIRRGNSEQWEELYKAWESGL